MGDYGCLCGEEGVCIYNLRSLCDRIVEVIKMTLPCAISGECNVTQEVCDVGLYG